MRRILVAGVFICVFLAFFALINKTPRKKPDSASPAQSQSAAKAEAAHALDIGDVEASFRLEGTLDARSQAGDVKEEKLTNMRQDLDMTTVTVTPPAPKELWVEFMAVARHPLDSPVAIRGKVFREKEQIGSFAAVIMPQKTGEAKYSVDVLAGLETPPASMVVHAEAELILLKADVDPSKVDAGALTAAPQEIGHLLSNPVVVQLAKDDKK